MFYTDETSWKKSWKNITDPIRDIFGEDAEALINAIETMEDDIDDGCIDNFRIALIGDENAEKAYENASGNGCCGFEDRIIEVNGRAYKIGCNYGH